MDKTTNPILDRDEFRARGVTVFEIIVAIVGLGFLVLVVWLIVALISYLMRH